MVTCARWACGRSTSARWATTSAGASRWRACGLRASISTTCNCGKAAPTSRPTSSSTAPPASAPCCGGGRIACASTRRDHARADHLRAPAAHRRPRHAGGGARGANRRRHGIPVTVDVDTIYHGFDRVLPYVDYLVASSEFPVQWTNESDPFKALESDPEGIRDARGRHDAGRARRAGAGATAGSSTRRLSWSTAWTPPAPATCSTGPSAMLCCKRCRCATLSISPTPWPR